MVKDENSLKQSILRVFKFLNKKLDLDSIILFGSYAMGEANDLSDVDLAIVSRDFEQMTLEQKAELFSDIKLNCDTDIEVHFFGTESLKEARPTNFLGYILSTGKYYIKDKKLVA